MLAHPVTRQSLACIRCGACLNACPVYRSVGGHAYGAVYPGPIGAVITPLLEGLAKAKQLPYASSLCGACREVCPVKIDIPELLLHLRAEITEGTANGVAVEEKVARRRGESLAFWLYSRMWKTPFRYRFFQKIARRTQRLLARNGQIGAVSGFVVSVAPSLGAWTAGRDAPTVAPESFRELWKRELKSGGDPQ